MCEKYVSMLQYQPHLVPIVVSLLNTLGQNDGFCAALCMMCAINTRPDRVGICKSL